jgi:N-methylhydantoinase B
MTTVSEARPTTTLDPGSYDVIGAEVHRKAMDEIAREMGITLERTSGSPVVTDAKDFSCTLLDENAEQLGFAGYVLFHVATSIGAVQAVLRNYELDDIKPGDAFVANDPHTSGAIHQGDMGFVMPYFYEDELVGWGYVNEHLLDVGGASVSGFAPEARDVFSEAMRFPGVRIVRDGRLQRDWQLYIASNVRVPVPVLNDMKSMIAALNTGHRRLVKVLDDYGLEKHREFCKINKVLTEQMIRNRIAQLPDGVYSAKSWVEYDGHGKAELYELGLDMTVDGDSMKFTFYGDPQVPSYVNGAWPAVVGQAYTTLQVMFIYDAPVNDGLWRPFTFDLGPAGTIVNSTPPAPVSQSHMETGMRVNRLVADVLSQAMALSPSPMLRTRVAGGPNNGAATMTMAGIQRESGWPTVIFPTSPTVGLGGAAQTVADGMDSYGVQCTPGVDQPSVETDEATGPLMVLWRRIEPSSSGAGEMRGGQGLSCALAIRGSDRMAGAAFNNTAEVPPAGAGGGLPGSATDYHIVRGSDLDDLLTKKIAPTVENIGGTIERVPSKMGALTMDEFDVFVVVGGGGPGLGDPLLREPAKLAKDIGDGYLIRDAVADIYGVVLADNGEVDEQATTDARRKIRAERIGGEPKREVDRGDEPEIGISIRLSDGHWNCAYCGEDLGEASGNFREACVDKTRVASELFAERKMFLRASTQDPVIVETDYYCPGCASTVQVDVNVQGADPHPAPRLTPEGLRLAQEQA